jgi:hypothetical protein
MKALFLMAHCILRFVSSVFSLLFIPARTIADATGLGSTEIKNHGGWATFMTNRCRFGDKTETNAGRAVRWRWFGGFNRFLPFAQTP